MPNAYHNLAGWLRDVKSVLTDEGYPLADSYYWELRAVLEQLLDNVPTETVDGDESDIIGDDESDADDVESEDGLADVVVQRPGDRGDASTVRRGPAARRTRKVGGAAGVADPLPRPVPEEGRSRRGRTAGVARAGGGVKRGTRKK